MVVMVVQQCRRIMQLKIVSMDFSGAPVVKNLLPVQRTRVLCLVREGFTCGRAAQRMHSSR